MRLIAARALTALFLAGGTWLRTTPAAAQPPQPAPGGAQHAVALMTGVIELLRAGGFGPEPAVDGRPGWGLQWCDDPVAHTATTVLTSRDPILWTELVGADGTVLGRGLVGLTGSKGWDQ